MTREEIITALERGDAPADVQHAAATMLRKIGRAPKPSAEKLDSTMQLIGCVEAETTRLGSRRKAYEAVAAATGRTESSVKRVFMAAKSHVNYIVDNSFAGDE